MYQPSIYLKQVGMVACGLTHSGPCWFSGRLSCTSRGESGFPLLRFGLALPTSDSDYLPIFNASAKSQQLTINRNMSQTVNQELKGSPREA